MKENIGYALIGFVFGGWCGTFLIATLHNKALDAVVEYLGELNRILGAEKAAEIEETLLELTGKN